VRQIKIDPLPFDLRKGNIDKKESRGIILIRGKQMKKILYLLITEAGIGLGLLISCNFPYIGAGFALMGLLPVIFLVRENR